MAQVSEMLIQKVWEKGLVVKGVDARVWRKDFCGAWIKREHYATQTNFAWTIDHVYPQKKGGTDDLINLRPMHRDNNLSKSYDYPSYQCALTSQNNENVLTTLRKTVNQELQDKLKTLGMG